MLAGSTWLQLVRLQSRRPLKTYAARVWRKKPSVAFSFSRKKLSPILSPKTNCDECRWNYMARNPRVAGSNPAVLVNPRRSSVRQSSEKFRQNFVVAAFILSNNSSGECPRNYIGDWRAKAQCRFESCRLDIVRGVAKSADAPVARKGCLFLKNLSSLFIYNSPPKEKLFLCLRKN